MFTTASAHSTASVAVVPNLSSSTATMNGEAACATWVGIATGYPQTVPKRPVWKRSPQVVSLIIRIRAAKRMLTASRYGWTSFSPAVRILTAAASSRSASVRISIAICEN